jgi:quinol-cytochrome oxidoreductase complex cytochrome b subunit
MILLRIILRLFLGFTLLPAVIALLAAVELLQLHWYNANPPILRTEDGPVVVPYEVEDLLPVWACLLIAGIALVYTIAAIRWIFKRKKTSSQGSR